MTETAPAPARLPDVPAPIVGSGGIRRRVQLPPGGTIDPFALAGHDRILMADAGRFLVGVGAAVTITLPGGLGDSVDVERALAALAELDCDDLLPSGTSTLRAVLAFGAFPFDRTTPAAQRNDRKINDRKMQYKERRGWNTNLH